MRWQMLLERRLKQAGASITGPRLAVFKAIHLYGPLTLNDLVTHLEGICNRATIYRTIKLFEDIGAVRRLRIGWKYKLELTDEFDSHHHHISCNQCGTTFVFAEDAKFEAYLETISQRFGFKAQQHQLEISGLCKACQNG